jgi:hypothetical protein
MKRILALSINKQTIILSLVILFFAILCTVFCFFINLWDVPLGILLGGISAIIPYVILTYKEDILSPRRSMRLSIVVVIIMFLLHAGALITSALVTYVAKVQLFNVFSTFGGIFIGLISNVIVNIIDGRRRNG